jgi:glycosyltransferase involved in cell wall biosynthesis
MRIAIFDYAVTPTNPIGSCHRRILASLCREHAFTVFSVRFDNPDPAQIEWVRIPAPGRPLVLLFAAFHLLAPIYYWLYRLTRRVKFDLVQGVESNLSFADVVYSQFCHAAYLASHWQPTGGSRLRTVFSWLDHSFHAWTEGPVYRRIGRIVVASEGLARELKHAYPCTAEKLQVLPNPVDIPFLRKPAEFDVLTLRRKLGITNNSIVLLFVALGHFERKGLPLLLEALRIMGRPEVKLMVVGGAPGLVELYRSKAARMCLAGRVFFTGMQHDVRPYLWTADAFVFPSAYEVFSLAILEAAAAGVPIIVTRLNGAEEFMRDSQNGFLIDRTPESIADGVRRLLELTSEERSALGRRAQLDVQKYSVERFSDAWRKVYEQSVA